MRVYWQLRIGQKPYSGNGTYQELAGQLHLPQMFSPNIAILRLDRLAFLTVLRSLFLPTLLEVSGYP
jgi:hypothetical protein